MKRFQSLARRIHNLPTHPTVQHLSRYLNSLQHHLHADPPHNAKSTATPKTPQTLWQRAAHPPLVLAIAVITLTSTFGYRFYNSPKLDIGKLAPQTIAAPAAANVEDPKATEDNRKLARTGALPVLRLDDEATRTIQRRLQLQLQQGDAMRQLAAPFPFTRTATLSLTVQTALRKMPEQQWQAVLRAVDPPNFTQNSTSLGTTSDLEVAPGAPISIAVQKQAIAELQAYRRSVELRQFWQVLTDITNARSRYAAAVTTLSTPVSLDLPNTFDLAVLDLTDAEWAHLRSQVPRVTDRILTQGISPGLPDSLRNEAVALHLEDLRSASSRGIANQLLTALLAPNLVRDDDQTRLRAEKAAQEVPPVMVSVRRNEVIIKEGETISSADFALLEHFGLSRREVDVLGLIGFTGLVSGSVAIVWLVKRRYAPGLRRRDGGLLWLLSLSSPLLIVFHVPPTNLPAVGFLVSSFYGSPVGLTMVALLTLLLGLGMQPAIAPLLASAASGLLCGWLGARLRSREELALLGVGAGIVQGMVYFLVSVITGAVWFTVLGGAAVQALLGLTWVIVGMGSSPFLEQLFDLVTTIRLVELANPNRPLLKRLAAEAPGTFQHTLFVATLAEAAARSLGCNVELVRTGTLYHDIGKMHDPQGFIENQMGGPNKHDTIADPWLSADIIKKHVTEGIVMARKARLPKAVQAFIPEHQGTMLIAYFHHQAQQLAIAAAGAITVKESDFRYDGPIPQSRETGIVMLADSCEAALRSLKDATPDEALTMINKILRARWQDHQLVESGLTRTEMTQIAEIFVQVWQQFNHQRIAYPKLTPPTPSSLLK